VCGRDLALTRIEPLPITPNPTHLKERPMTSIRDLTTATGLPEDTPLKNLPGITWHVTNPLARHWITTLGQLAEHTDDDLLAVRGFGQRRLDALRTALQHAAQAETATR
jgi:hypothetical protein